MILNFIIDSSSFEKGLGNISIWSAINDPNLTINAYLPLYTIQELDFQRFKRKNVVAKKSLHFIDGLQNSDSFKLHLEYPELNEAISWKETVRASQQDSYTTLTQQQLAAIPIRFKKLLKSCYYKCHFKDPQNEHNNDPNEHGWVLVTEDEDIRALARQFQIPFVSVVEADTIINACIKDKSYLVNKNFSEKVIQRAGKVKEEKDGKKVFVTSFDTEFLAPRSKKGELWTPKSSHKK